jgi:hypothetical protein
MIDLGAARQELCLLCGRRLDLCIQDQDLAGLLHRILDERHGGPFPGTHSLAGEARLWVVGGQAPFAGITPV